MPTERNSVQTEHITKLRQTLTAQDLVCVRGGREVFRGVSFEIASGETLLIKGPNGAGKSSLLRAIAGLCRLSEGSLNFAHDAATGEDEGSIPSQCHYFGHSDALKSALTVSENLQFWHEFMGQPAQPVTDALVEMGLDHLGDIPAAYLSAGQKRRLSLARLLVSHRPIWLLDEPSAALDASSEQRLLALMDNHVAQGGIILAATHLPLKVSHAKELRLEAPQ
ncbi:MAG: heme ABC exporter ATP-binding protein CcmA [Stappiaceae bacterium]